jgi:hypothetical protein
MEARILQFNYDEPTILPGDRWALYVNFQIVGINERNAHNENVYTLVCSKQYQDNPGEEPLDEKTIVVDGLNKAEIEANIQKIIDQINGLNLKTWNDYYTELEKYFFVDESKIA